MYLPLEYGIKYFIVLLLVQIAEQKALGHCIRKPLSLLICFRMDHLNMQQVGRGKGGREIFLLCKNKGGIKYKTTVSPIVDQPELPFL